MTTLNDHEMYIRHQQTAINNIDNCVLIAQQPMSKEDATAATMYLSEKQVDKLTALMRNNISVNASNAVFLPSLNICLADFLLKLQYSLQEEPEELFSLDCVRLNGGAASWVLADSDNFHYNDIDIIINICLSKDRWSHIKDIVARCLLQAHRPERKTFRPEENKHCIETVRLNYLHRSVRIAKNNDLWALISLQNSSGHNLELKFVEQMKRPFQFSVDSFQITLTAEFLDRVLTQDCHKFQVEAVSMYGDIGSALSHLNQSRIVTVYPEEIRGGGLLKYCELIVRGFTAENSMNQMEKYMCTRFFIDFKGFDQQGRRLVDYLNSHFKFNEDLLRHKFLTVFRQVIERSGTCLMFRERQLCIYLAANLTNQILHQYQLKLALASSRNIGKIYFVNSVAFQGCVLKADSVEVFYH